jgi:AraC-like DNA-binding protein/ligand-binding sensor protein
MIDHSTGGTAATTTANTSDAEVLARLGKSKLFQQYQDAFQTATGLPLVLRPIGGACGGVDAGARNVSAFCGFMARRKSTCAACVETHAAIAANARNSERTAACFAGLHDSFVPICLGERVVGHLQTGQVLFQEPSEAQFQSAVKQLRILDREISADELRQAFFASRVIPREHYDATLRLLTSFAQHLSLLANELMLSHATSEPATVTRARAYIAQHLTEDLTLAEVARAANTSPFYFCKVFKSATGLTLTDYVARARVEKAKQLLLNSQTRISEAAFAAGFQSLSQFNRVFRRVTGAAPTHFRREVEASSAPTAAHSEFRETAGAEL